MTIKVETISVSEAAKRVAEVYVDKEQQLKTDLSKAVTHAQIRSASDAHSEQQVDSDLNQSKSRKLNK